MADLLKTTIIAGATEALTGLTEHGQVKIGIGGTEPAILVEQELHDTGPVRGPIYEGKLPCVVLDYVGTKLWITNKSAGTINVRVGQVA